MEDLVKEIQDMVDELIAVPDLEVKYKDNTFEIHCDDRTELSAQFAMILVTGFLRGKFGGNANAVLH